MVRVLLMVAGGVLTGGALTACGGPSVDTACPVSDLTHEVEHIVEESLLSVDSVDELRCAGEWAVVTATITGDGVEATSDTFVFRKPADVWVLKSPELVCDPAAGDEAITGDLAAQVCEGS